MPAPRLQYVSNAQLIAAGAQIYNEFCDPTYAPGMGETVMRAVDAGREEAFFAPAVRFAGNIALVTCCQDKVFEQLPTEVSERAEVAEDIAGFIGRQGASTGLFVDVYGRDRYLQRGMRERPRLAADLRDAEYIASQCGAPFIEVGRVAGGAFHALRKRGVNRGQADIVALSRSLPLVASIPKEHATEVYIELGVPYVAPGNYLVSRVGGQITIEFTRRTCDLLRSYMLPLRGCPAANVYPYGPDLGNLLRESWESIVHFLLFEGAKVTF